MKCELCGYQASPSNIGHLRHCFIDNDRTKATVLCHWCIQDLREVGMEVEAI